MLLMRTAIVSHVARQKYSREALVLLSRTNSLRGLTDLRSHRWIDVYRPLITSAASYRFFSDRLLGYSPMAPSAPSPVLQAGGVEIKGKIPTAQELTTIGGVWAPTSAKRDKLVELKAALEKSQQSLDDVATPEQKLDLYLADGIQLIARQTDSVPVEAARADVFVLLERCLDEQSTIYPEMLDETRWNSYLTRVSDELGVILSTLPAGTYLPYVRDFYDPLLLNPEELSHVPENGMQAAFLNSVIRFRLHLAQAAVQHMKLSWKALTTVSDGDVDRAAVVDSTLDKQATTLSRSQLNDVLLSYAFGTCTDRVGAWWKLLDRDGDGLLDQSEMDQIASLSMAPVQKALVTLFEESLEAYPVRAPLPPLGEDNNYIIPKPKGWRKRRKEKNTKSWLVKLFKRAVQNHFVDEVELSHRLRCIYAWAEKAHQKNKIDSVLVESSFGRKRYVELSPKISLDEFREVQREHFSHLDRVGTEIVKSFREDLWVVQGKGRQNRELIMGCLSYFALVSVVDFIIISL